jgi:GNAT superfamily N-acetyltransferase
VRPFWLSAFLDLPVETFDDTVRFWAAASGCTVSAPRGEHGEFATLVPADGDDHLRVQRLDRGPARLHLDLHTQDPRGLADAAVGLGAVELADRGHVVLRSPGGLVVCCVSHPASRVPTASTWPGGHRSRVDQVCLDLPVAVHAPETAFWSALLGAEVTASSGHPQFSRLDVDGFPMRILLQRLDEPDGPAGAHLDLAVSDRSAETARHVALGAAVERQEPWWTVLRDPAGLAYCLTDRDPVRGRPGRDEGEPSRTGPDRGSVSEASGSDPRIRTAVPADWTRIWPVFSAVVADGETYAYPEDLTADEARHLWLGSPPGHTVVLEEDGVLLGTATMGPNRPGRGDHVGTASFMVAAEARGRGVGRALGEYVVEWHRRQGYRAIQFNAVVETNTAAVRLWHRLGFRVVGTVPGAFRSRRHGYVGLHVMHLDLVAEDG